MTDKPWTAPSLLAKDRALMAEIEIAKIAGVVTLHYEGICIIIEALDAHARDAKPQWTKVEERLPDSNRYVWGFDGSFVIRAWYSDIFGWRNERMDIVKITHWQEEYIPEPPREDAP
ncbi:MAG TPA: DUF551 domain-containing protein [Bryobacteraceae bacterium]|nr:DUF551 domain-containing protein [Bryobacteraceae bacterium]